MPASTADAEHLIEAGRHADALAAWQSISAVNPAASRPRARIAACLVALGRHTEAVEVLTPLADELPGQPLIQLRLAIARSALGDADGALSALGIAADAGLRPSSGFEAEAAFHPIRSNAWFVALCDRIARNDAPTADDPAFRAFDFWVGSWDARTADGALQGRNDIEIVLGGAALIERWSGATGYRGTSLNRYDRRTATWHQTWVDDQGDVVEFVDGRADGGRLVFGAIDADGGRRRLAFEDGGPNAFRQHSQRSDDDGATWTTEYDFLYTRRAPGAATA